MTISTLNNGQYNHLYLFTLSDYAIRILHTPRHTRANPSIQNANQWHILKPPLYHTLSRLVTWTIPIDTNHTQGGTSKVYRQIILRRVYYIQSTSDNQFYFPNHNTMHNLIYLYIPVAIIALALTLAIKEFHNFQKERTVSFKIKK